ncbi:MAG: hypothetical protein A3D10_06905 [Omnitrophica WOR_2 bacterium RIFCSPHIGHO2_02_FULL_48_11]|nr:MAG: hypothetical protein A3D10_06905 [Omnitrophica WOR_2 bacterium RIFCSPHIGHO2_02_FULL_48_11]
MVMKFNPTFRFTLFISLLLLFGLSAYIFRIDINYFKSLLVGLPLSVAGFLYIVIYVGVTTLVWFGTIDFFRITGAIMFGPYWSTLFVWIAETANASILFHLSRDLGREFVRQKFNLKDKDLQYAKEGGGFWRVFILRINPLVPFRLMDIGFGLSKVSFRKYFWGVVLGSPLRIFWLQFVIFGIEKTILSNPQALMDYFSHNPKAFLFSVSYLGGVAVLTVAAVIVAIIKKSQGHQVTRHL